MGKANNDLQFAEISCWLQPFPEQVLLAGELCWTSHYHSGYGVMEHLDHVELGRAMRYNRLYSVAFNFGLCVRQFVTTSVYPALLQQPGSRE